MNEPRRLPRLRVALAVVLASSLVVGCSVLRKKRDAGTEDPPVTNAPTVSASGTGAKNEKDVLRYANETKLASEPGIIGKDVAKVKTFPGSGADVATLTKGTAVTQLAKYFSTGVLVLFDDPRAVDGSKLLGWVAPEALAPPVTAHPGVPATATARVVALDAGGPASTDAGAAKPDAAAPGAPTPLLQVLPTAGKCPPGYAVFGPFCRRPCSADGDCPKGTFCTVGTGGKRSCSATR
jgi:hypothetical protein